MQLIQLLYIKEVLEELCEALSNVGSHGSYQKLEELQKIALKAKENFYCNINPHLHEILEDPSIFINTEEVGATGKAIKSNPGDLCEGVGATGKAIKSNLPYKTEDDIYYVNYQFQCITLVDEYKNKSFKELEDISNRKGPQSSSSSSDEVTAPKQRKLEQPLPSVSISSASGFGQSAPSTSKFGHKKQKAESSLDESTEISSDDSYAPSVRSAKYCQLEKMYTKMRKRNFVLQKKLRSCHLKLKRSSRIIASQKEIILEQAGSINYLNNYLENVITHFSEPQVSGSEDLQI